jgi:hypothetical protein
LVRATADDSDKGLEKCRGHHARRDTIPSAASTE